MGKKTIAVIFGGCSPEYEVSLKSSYSIINAIDRSKYDIVQIGITKQGKWYRFSGSVEDIQNDKWCEDKALLTRAFISPERGAGLLEIADDKLSSLPIDAAFPVLHGRFGEDGTIQGLCELAGIPVVGSGAAASALCMDKDRAHKLVSLAGIRVPRSKCFEYVPDKQELLAAAQELKLPLFVKPVKAGSSFGISKVEHISELFQAVEKAYEIDNAIIIEENIDGFETGISIVGNDDLIVGRVDEIELVGGLFTYEEKYSAGTSTIHLPARISAEMENRLLEAGKRIYKELGCKGYCRVDIFVTKDGDIVFNEANTIPGFTSKSRFPNMMKGIGMEYPQLVDRLIELSFEKQ